MDWNNDGKLDILLGDFYSRKNDDGKRTAGGNVWLFLGETAKAATLIGGAILMAALVFNALSGLRRRPPPLTF